MPYINTIDINGVIYTLENLTDGNNIVTLPTLSRDDVFVLRGNIVNNTSSTSTTQPLSANQGKVLRDALNAEIQNRTNDVNLEEERATEAERVLTENLNKEITNRTNDVNAEETRATNAENTLTTNLNAEIARAKKAEADELARAKAAENVLTDNLSAEVTRATNKENSINTALTNEVSRATGAENTLTTNLNAEIARAKAAESANSTAISTEKSRAEGVESGLASRIATMEAFFKEADIDASKDFIDTLKEIQSYIASDKTGVTAMTASINANKTAIETEASRAKSAESTLQSSINTEATTARAAEKANADAISALTKKHNEEIATKVDKVDGMGLSSNDYTDAEKTKLNGIASGANKYEHPTYDVHESGLYKITVDASGHVSAVEDVSKDDIVALGIPAQDTTYSVVTDSSDGLLSAGDKQKYDEYNDRIGEIVSALAESVDYIVEQGNSGSWTYRKWNSGTSECWGILTGTVSPSDVDSNIAGFSVFDVSWNFPDDLFVSTPNVTYNCNIGDGFSFPAQNTSSAKVFSCTALSTETNSDVAFKISAKASGMWK